LGCLGNLNRNKYALGGIVTSDIDVQIVLDYVLNTGYKDIGFTEDERKDLAARCSVLHLGQDSRIWSRRFYDGRQNKVISESNTMPHKLGLQRVHVEKSGVVEYKISKRRLDVHLVNGNVPRTVLITIPGVGDTVIPIDLEHAERGGFRKHQGIALPFDRFNERTGIQALYVPEGAGDIQQYGVESLDQLSRFTLLQS
jgi:hypothetical protein